MKKIFFYLLIFLSLTNPIQAGKLGSFLSKTDGEATLNNTIQQLETVVHLKNYYYNLAVTNRLEMAQRTLKAIKYSRDNAASGKADELAFQLGQYAEKLMLKKSIPSKKESILIIRDLMNLAEEYKKMLLAAGAHKSTSEQQEVAEIIERQPLSSNPFQALISYHEYKNNCSRSTIDEADLKYLVASEEDVHKKIAALPEQQLIGPKIVGSRAKI